MAVVDFADWYARALRSGICTRFLDPVVVFRRIHRNNTTRSRRGALHRDYIWIAREAISRREAAVDRSS
jgi:hypothetical protein